MSRLDDLADAPRKMARRLLCKLSPEALMQLAPSIYDKHENPRPGCGVPEVQQTIKEVLLQLSPTALRKACGKSGDEVVTWVHGYGK